MDDLQLLNEVLGEGKNITFYLQSLLMVQGGAADGGMCPMRPNKVPFMSLHENLTLWNLQVVSFYFQ